MTTSTIPAAEGAERGDLAPAECFTVTIGTEPNTLVVQGIAGRYASVRTVWLDRGRGRFTALDAAGAPLTAPHDSARHVSVDWDGTSGWMGIYTVTATRWAGTSRDEALANATAELHTT